MSTYSPVTIKAAGAAEFLGLLPSMLGYVPTRSVVLVPFAGSKSIGAMRFDLPDTESEPRVASTMIGIVCRLEDATAVIAVVYTDEPSLSTAGLFGHLAHEAQVCGLEIRELIYVAADGWGDPLSADEPHPLSEITRHPDAPPPAGGDQAAGAELPDVDEAVHRAVLDQVSDFPVTATDAEILMLLEGWAIAEAQPRMLAVMHWMLERPALRDVGVLTWVLGIPGGVQAIAAQCDFEEGGQYPAELAQVMWGEGPRPDTARLEQALTNTRTLLAILPLPGAFATAAWLAWAIGRSSQADAYVKRARHIDDEHGLANIVAAFVSAGHLPNWAFQR